jgi:hypothetical protein
MSSTHEVIPAAKPEQIRETKMVSMASSRAFIGLIAAVLLFGFALRCMPRSFSRANVRRRAATRKR